MTSYCARNLLFVLFAISGFTALIYESIWAQYLKLFLGHAAYAQALVLSIFMGGMALGAWLTSKWMARWNNLFLVYVVVEGLIGLFGIFFHEIFQIILEISYDTVIPAIDNITIIYLYRWTSAILLILPQSILLGMTFPLMSNGIIRRYPLTPGSSLAMLYFTNSIGAAIGVLISGFYLIGLAGLPGTILFAATLNIFLAIIVFGLTHKWSNPAPVNTGKLSVTQISFPLLILSAAFITGMASFIYEISWIRMLSMVLGASTHSFELMLSAFIAGLAFGGLWIRSRIDHLENPMIHAGIIQIIMGLLALATLPLYNKNFDVMAFFMSALTKSDAGYYLFTLSSHFIAMMVMLPVTFFAGMTLPLFTNILLQHGYGESSVGQVYASNTLGAIAGVVFTIFIGMPVLGLKGAMLFGCSLDIILGFVLIILTISHKRKPVVVTAIFCLTTMIIVGQMTNFNHYKMASGVFRYGHIELNPDVKLRFQKDGKTASVHVLEFPSGTVSISTNGKSDASININNDELIAPDEITMVMAAALPVSIYPDAKSVAVIGIGSGLSTHTVLTWPNIERVDTIEIEPAMLEGANLFRPRVERAYADPRSHFYIEDAKTFFSTHRKKYDIIISVPSNPWVSGVASLYTDEFYRRITGYLTKNGVFAQWVQAYEINLDLVFSVISSVRNNFSDFVLYATTDGDMIILARNNQSINLPGEIIFEENEMKNELAQVKISGIQDFLIRFIGNNYLIGPFLDTYQPVKNSDYFPILDLNASRARFMGENVYDLTRIRLEPVPVIKMLLPEIDSYESTNIGEDHLLSASKNAYMATLLFNHIKKEAGESLKNPNIEKLELLIKFADSCNAIDYPDIWIENLYTLMQVTLPYLSTSELSKLWNAITPNCESDLDEDQRNWLILANALGEREAGLAVNIANQLLNQGTKWGIEKQRFLFTTSMLSLVKLDEYHAAHKLWSQHADKLFKNTDIPISLSILYGLALQGTLNGNISTQSVR